MKTRAFFPEAKRDGFTLTEMLVSVGLLLLVMAIFTQIFALATTSMSNQRGLAMNDKRARTVFTIIDHDLKQISYRAVPGQAGIAPMQPGMFYEDANAHENQQGYVHIAENDPNSDEDDVLQFTIDTTLTHQRYATQQNLQLYGRAANYRNSITDRDEPDWDDGTPFDDVTTSSKAEVVYFLRRGTLYRRVLLLREPNLRYQVPPQPNDNNYDGDGVDFPVELVGQPVYVAGGGRRLMFDQSLSSPFYDGEFYRDYDLSAHCAEYELDGPGTTIPLAVLHTSLLNDANVNPFPLGVPHYRYGFNPLTGLPRSFFESGGSNFYFGRFTADETSSTANDFEYPISLAGNPYTQAMTSADVDSLVGKGRLTTFSGGNRIGADILMTNVLSFDVEVWDQGLQAYVDIGASGAVHFNSSENQNAAYGSATDGGLIGAIGRNTFDTWYNDFSNVSSGVFTATTTPGGANALPPFEAFLAAPDAVITASTTDNIKRWGNGETVNAGDIFFAPAGSTPFGNRVYFMPNLINTGTMTIEADAVNPFDQNITLNLNSLVNYTTSTFIDDNNDYDNADTDNSAGTNSNGPDLSWTAFVANSVAFPGVDLTPRPLRSIRVTINFRDPNSEQIRQMTMVHSFALQSN